MSEVKGIYIGGTPVKFKDETSRNFISDVYDENKTYAEGEYCINDNKLYICTTATGNCGFDGSCWKETNIATEVSEQNKNLGGLRFGIDGDGNYGYYGADDSLIPFKSGIPVTLQRIASVTTKGNKTFDIPEGTTFAVITHIRYGEYGITSKTPTGDIVKSVCEIPVNEHSVDSIGRNVQCKGYICELTGKAGTITTYCTDSGSGYSYTITTRVFTN